MPRRLAAAAVILASALGLAACSTDAAVNNAREACKYVAKANVAYVASQHATGPRQLALINVARGLLSNGEPFAASATSDDGQWNALMTSLNQAQDINLDYVMPTLLDQCKAAASGDSMLGGGGAPQTTLPSSVTAPG